MRPHRWQPTRLLSPWDSPGKNTGVGCHFLLQCMEVKSESEVAQSCPTPRDPMDCSLPGSSVHGIFQARVLEWGAIAFSDNGILLSHKKEQAIIHTMTLLILKSAVLSVEVRYQRLHSLAFLLCDIFGKGKPPGRTNERLQGAGWRRGWGKRRQEGIGDRMLCILILVAVTGFSVAVKTHKTTRQKERSLNVFQFKCWG